MPVGPHGSKVALINGAKLGGRAARLEEWQAWWWGGHNGLDDDDDSATSWAVS